MLTITPIEITPYTGIEPISIPLSLFEMAVSFQYILIKINLNTNALMIIFNHNRFRSIPFSNKIGEIEWASNNIPNLFYKFLIWHFHRTIWTQIITTTHIKIGEFDIIVCCLLITCGTFCRSKPITLHTHDSIIYFLHMSIPFIF